MIVSQLLLVGVALAGGAVVLLSKATTVVAPEDLKLFEDRYGARGLKVISVRRIGTRWLYFDPRGRRSPIRQYEIELEQPDGRREIRRRGVSRDSWLGDRLWRVDENGRIERLS
jgi:hypothetical protein